VKFLQKGLKEKPAVIAGEDIAKLLKRLDESYSDDGESHRCDGVAHRRAAGRRGLIGGRHREETDLLRSAIEKSSFFRSVTG